jgi:hypothetical protein
VKCQVDKCENEVIYSGVDSFILNVPTEKVCYECANTYNYVSKIKNDYYAEYDRLNNNA